MGKGGSKEAQPVDSTEPTEESEHSKGNADLADGASANTEFLYDTTKSKWDHICCVLTALQEDISEANLNAPYHYICLIEEIKNLIGVCLDEDILYERLNNLSIELFSFEEESHVKNLLEQIQGLCGYIFGRNPEVILLGETGTGKSTLGNVFLKGRSAFLEPVFESSSKSDSCTKLVSSFTGKWLGAGHELTVVDCPGLNDATNSDLEHTKRITKEVKEMCNVTAFVLVLNAKEPRLKKSHYEMLKIFLHVFKKDFFDNLVIFFTNWSMDDIAIKSRRYSRINEKSKTDDICQSIRNEFELEKNIKCFFLDSVEYVMDTSSTHEHVLKEFDEYVENMCRYNTRNVAVGL